MKQAIQLFRPVRDETSLCAPGGPVEGYGSQGLSTQPHAVHVRPLRSQIRQRMVALAVGVYESNSTDAIPQELPPVLAILR